MGIIRNKLFPLKRRNGGNYRIMPGKNKNLGVGFLGIVYKDALELEFSKNNIYYEREKEYRINYKGQKLVSGARYNPGV